MLKGGSRSGALTNALSKVSKVAAVLPLCASLVEVVCILLSGWV